MPSLGGPELLILLVIAILIFGVGKLGDVGGAIGRGIREFRNEVRSPDDETPRLDDEVQRRP